MAKTTVKFTAQKTIQRPTTVKFKTKDGKSVTFNATETVKVPTQVSFPVRRKKK